MTFAPMAKMNSICFIDLFSIFYQLDMENGFLDGFIIKVVWITTTLGFWFPSYEGK